jgi:hypothetical protein
VLGTAKELLRVMGKAAGGKIGVGEGNQRCGQESSKVRERAAR